MSDLQEKLDAIDLEPFLDNEGVRYKTTAGRSTNLNLQCCPECGDRRWRTYVNAESLRHRLTRCLAATKWPASATTAQLGRLVSAHNTHQHTQIPVIPWHFSRAHWPLAFPSACDLAPPSLAPIICA